MAEPRSQSQIYKRRVRRKSHNHDDDDASIDIRIGNRKVAGYYLHIQASSSADSGRFLRMIDDSIRLNPRDPIIISINGYQPWLEDVLGSCIDDRGSELSGLNRELQFDDTVKFPERSNRRTKTAPWSFIIDMMNVPEVYYWTFNQRPPAYDYTCHIDSYRFRVAVWNCGRGAFRFDDRTPVTIIFTRPTVTGDCVVRDLLFANLYGDQEFDFPRKDEEGVCWIFLRMYWLLTDWQNIVREIEREVGEAEINSRGRRYPVKVRSRAMHKQVDRLYELKQYLRFHSRSFKKLVKLRATSLDPNQEISHPVWDEMDNAVDDLDQFDYYLDSLKERFNNLIELEFNIENANQSDYSRFLSVIAALYLPISYLASIFGITTMDVRPIVYLYIAIPLLVASLVFAMIFPLLVRRFRRLRYPHQSKHLQLPRHRFTMLGDELPDSADVPQNVKLNVHGRAQSQQNNEDQAGPPPRAVSTSGSSRRVRLPLHKRDRKQHRNNEKG